MAARSAFTENSLLGWVHTDTTSRETHTESYCPLSTVQSLQQCWPTDRHHRHDNCSPPEDEISFSLNVCDALGLSSWTIRRRQIGRGECVIRSLACCWDHSFAMKAALRLLFAVSCPTRLGLSRRCCPCFSALPTLLRGAATGSSGLSTTASTAPSAAPPFTPAQLLASPSSAAALPCSVVLPTYDRSAVQPGIVHLGLGAFPRAHLAYYMDALLHTKHPTAAPWGIVGVGVRREDRRVSEALKGQDGLYTVVGRGEAAEDVEVRVVGSVLEYIFAPDEPQRLLDRLLSPHTRIVSLTVTELRGLRQ